MHEVAMAGQTWRRAVIRSVFGGALAGQALFALPAFAESKAETSQPHCPPTPGADYFDQAPTPPGKWTMPQRSPSSNLPQGTSQDEIPGGNPPPLFPDSGTSPLSDFPGASPADAFDSAATVDV